MYTYVFKNYFILIIPHFTFGLGDGGVYSATGLGSTGFCDRPRVLTLIVHAQPGDNQTTNAKKKVACVCVVAA